jgi:hypothetical protein
MARIRTIKPEFWEDEKMASLPIPCRLFYIGTWSIADDNGVFRGNPVMLKSKIFPYDENLRASEVQKWLNALVEARMLIPIINDPRIGGSEESYYVIRTFHSHQKFDARYPNYLIDSELLNEILSTKDVPYVHPTSTQRVPDGYSSGAQHGKGTGNGKGNGNKPPTPLKGDKFDFSFLNPELSETFQAWLSYKKAKNQTYKTQKSVQACYSRLVNLAGGDVETAKLIVEQSMANNWAGLFELKYQKNTREIIDKNGNKITITENGGAMGGGYSANGPHSFRTDAEKRRNEREMLAENAEAFLRKSKT